MFVAIGYFEGYWFENQLAQPCLDMRLFTIYLFICVQAFIPGIQRNTSVT